MKKLLVILLSFFLIFLFYQPDVPQKIRYDQGEIETYFCPRDNCTAALLDVLSSAQESLHCAFYDLELPEVIAALERDDIDVRVVADSDAGVKFAKGDERSSYMHNKFCIIDGKTVFTGSFNPTYNGAYKNYNNMVVVQSSALAEQYEEEFMELWSGVFGKGTSKKYPVVVSRKRMHAYFCPEDGCGLLIKEMIYNATESVHFMTFSFTHKGIGNALLLMKDKISIHGLLEKRQISRYSMYDVFAYQGMDVRNVSLPGKLHHKVFIIDNETVITGSMNPSRNGDERNDENVLVIKDRDVAREYLAEFERIRDLGN